VAELVDALL